MRRTWKQQAASALFGMTLGLIIPALALGDTATLLPNAKQQYTNDAGVPVANGSVTYYIPTTSTKKTIWQDAAETTPQTNPVILDAAGRPQPAGQTYGSGSYRQVVKDADGLVVWDAVTTSTGGGGSTPVVPTVGDGLVVGSVLPWTGLTPPPNYLFANGQAVLRTGYPLFFSTTTIVANVICTSGLNILSGLSDTQNIRIGAKVEASCIPPGTTVTAVSTTSTTISASASVSTAVAATYFPYGNGNGSTTFNLPDLRGQTIVGRNNMGGTASSVLTSPYFGTGPNAIGAAGGTQSHSQTANEVGPHFHSVFLVDPGHIHGTTSVGGASALYSAGGSQAFTSGGFATSAVNGGFTINSAVTGAGVFSAASAGVANRTDFTGSGIPFSVVQPSTTLNYVIKVLPDNSTVVSSGVASIGGMTGDILCGTNIVCGSNTISALFPVIVVDALNVHYTAPFTGSVARTQDLVNAQLLSIQDFGCVADSGVTDNGPCLRAAYDAAAANGRAVFIPPALGYYGVSTCRNNAVFDGTSLTVANGNKSVPIYGLGWSEKPFAAPSGAFLLPNSSFPSTCSWFRLSGSDKVAGSIYKGFGIGEFGGSLGTPKGLHMFFWDASSPTYYQQNTRIDNIYLGNTATGYSFKCTTGSAVTPGCIPDGSITNSKFMNFNADFLADHVTIGPQNTIGQNATVDSRNVGIEFAQCSGCTSTTIEGNNISNFNGMVVVRGANKPVIRDNEMEMSAGFTNTRGAMIDLVGDVSVVEAFTVTGNQLAQNSLVGDYAPVKVQNAISGQTYDNRIGLAKATAYDYVSMTVDAAGTFLGYNRCSYANATSTVTDFACTVSSLGGARGFQYTPFGFSLPGSTSGRATINTQAAAGAAALLWPTTSGTLASSATSPLVLSATTGILTCPTCATTGGANIPTIATGDILFGSAANTLSALADVATGNALISGGVGVAPSWGKIGISTHVSGLGTGVATFLGTPSSANLLAALTTSTGTGNAVFSAGPTFTGTITAAAATFSGTVTLPSPIINGLPTGTGVATANTVSTLVARDGSGNFAAGTITAALSGNATTATSATSATTATSATNTAITNDTTTNATMFPTWVTANTGNLPQTVTSTKLTFNPSTGVLSSTSFTGAGTGLTGTAASLTAGAVTTNANLTGAVTSVGNATSLGSFTSANLLGALTDETGTGVAVFGTTPTLATPVINGLPTGTGVATANTVSTLVARDASGNFTAGTGNFTALTMAAGSGAFGAGNSATSGQLTTMLLNGGSSAGSYMAWQAGNVTYAFLGNDRAILGAANDNFLIQSQSGDGMHFQTNGTNTDRIAISSAGVVSMPTLGSDAATVDNTVCVSGTGVILKGSGTLGICLGTSSARYKHDIVDMSSGLAQIVRLNPKNFSYNEGYGDGGVRRQYGFIAEDVINVLPGLTGLDSDGKPSSVDMIGLVPVMVKAIQELKSDNDNLRACQQDWKCRIFGYGSKG